MLPSMAKATLVDVIKDLEIGYPDHPDGSKVISRVLKRWKRRIQDQSQRRRTDYKIGVGGGDGAMS